MYIPKHFEWTDEAAIGDFIRANSFGTLTTIVDGVPYATHLPFLYDAEQKVLLAHVAKANSQWRNMDGQTALAVFTGPHAYISPSWYEVAESVPTWNYVAVHVTGKCAVIDDETELLRLLEQTVRFYEPESTLPAQAGERFYRNMMKAIVGFRIHITRVEGKRKLSQNKSGEVQQRVIDHLLQAGDTGAAGVAKLMQDRLAAVTGTGQADE